MTTTADAPLVQLEDVDLMNHFSGDNNAEKNNTKHTQQHHPQQQQQHQQQQQQQVTTEVEVCVDVDNRCEE